MALLQSAFCMLVNAKCLQHRRKLASIFRILRTHEFNTGMLSISRILCMQEPQMLLHFPGLCARKGSKCCSKSVTLQGFCARKGSTCFNFQELWHTRTQHAFIAKDSKSLNFPRSFACIFGALDRLYRLGSKNGHSRENFDPDMGNPSCQYNPAYLCRAYSGRGRILNMYKYALTYLIPGEYIGITFRLAGTASTFQTSCTGGGSLNSSQIRMFGTSLHTSYHCYQKGYRPKKIFGG